jgi:hypothetical protein
MCFIWCAAMGLGRCKVDNGGCWQDKKGEVYFSACKVNFVLNFLVLALSSSLDKWKSQMFSFSSGHSDEARSLLY